MFRVEAIRRFADNETINRMYFLHPETDPEAYDFVVLTSLGRFLYRERDNSFTHGETLLPHTFGSGGLYDAYYDRLRHFSLDEADSFATGYYPGYGQVVLYIRFQENVAIAESIFLKAPSKRFYEFLQAVGIRFLGGEETDGLYHAKYENTLSRHIASGILADFSRTDNCNLFFFLHGNINTELADGLIRAGRKRLESEQHRILERLAAIAERSMVEKLQMQMLLPQGSETPGFGDVVPKGFIYGALRDRMPEAELTERYRQSLEGDKLRGLWTFEKNDLETSVDSSLVLMNTYDVTAAELLGKFRDEATGAYLPQVAHENPEEGQMQYVPEKHHWCRDDIATSVLIGRLLADHGLAVDDKLRRYISDKFGQRSDLYFANPYFVDWLYALGLAVPDNGPALKEKLKEEILASVREDFSVGQYDKVFSTACAILALKELGCDDNFLFGLQLYVLNHYQDPREQQPTPFYSSLILAEKDDHSGRVCKVGDTSLSVYLYRDVHSMIYTALVSRCLSIAVSPDAGGASLEQYISRTAEPRYAAPDHLTYIAEFSLPNYL